jgi:predicted nucleotidyltransferase
MVSKNIQSMIPKIQQYFIGQPIKKAWLFGSSSRGEERDDSDIDILVQYDEDAGISLFTISRIMVQMKKMLGRDVDLVEEDRLLPFAAKSANQDKILIYERKN